ncbi:MAG TPA: NifB/NifX family molybdenum-iron cluster-binding protein [Candidatus Brocadiia bacterium]|nr:NifB/NifX family molybdenum-iron cluster-binding protein [Candidatus Brocadiia bacterium]
MVRVAIPAWDGRVSPVFDTAQRVLFFDVGAEGRRPVGEGDFAGASAAERVARLKALGAQALVCGAVSAELGAMVTAAGIRLVAFVSGGVEEVLAAFEQGGLEAPWFSMPGCCGARWRRGCGRQFRGGRYR